MFESKKASRGGVKPLIGFFSESGGGKTYTALLVARGLVGPTGNIQQIDTEAGRGELYSDIIPGGYNTIRMSEPFAPSRYVEAVRFAEQQGADVIVIDQISNAWEGIGGVLDLAGQNEESGKKGLAVWKTPKMEHAKMMVRLLQSPCPIIVCLRAKYKSRQVKQNGKTEIVKDDYLTPIQADDFVFEMTTHAQLNLNHSIIVTKISHPGLRDCFPADNTEPLSLATGEAIARWAANPGKASGPQTKAAPSGRQALKRALCEAVKARAGVDPAGVEKWLWEEGLLDGEHERLAEISDERMQEITNKVSGKISSGEAMALAHAGDGEPHGELL